MWLALTLLSAVFLGIYDITKKKSLKKNSVLWVLFSSTALSVIILIPWFSPGPMINYYLLIPKALLVTISLTSGLQAMETLPLTTVSTLKATRPVFVILFSIIIYGERLNLMQWAGVFISFIAIWMLSRSSRKEGIYFSSNKGIFWMAISIFSGVASVLYDKFAISRMEPMFVLCWGNLFITICIGIVLLIKSIHDGDKRAHFTPDWYIVITTILVILADTCYFNALKQEGALLSLVSLLRRCSVIITFVMSTIIFKEHNIREKALEMGILFVGVLLLAFSL